MLTSVHFFTLLQMYIVKTANRPQRRPAAYSRQSLRGSFTPDGTRRSGQQWIGTGSDPNTVQMPCISHEQALKTPRPK